MSVHPSAFIHPMAAVDDQAVIGEGCEIGPFSVIGPDVVLHAGVVVKSHAIVVFVGNRDDEAVQAVLRQLLSQGVEAGFVGVHKHGVCPEWDRPALRASCGQHRCSE